MNLLREYIREQLLIEKNAASSQLDRDLMGEIGEFMDTRHYDDVLDSVFTKIAPNLVRHVLEQEINEDVAEFRDGAIEGRWEKRNGWDFEDPSPEEFGIPKDSIDYTLGYTWGWNNANTWKGNKLPAKAKKESVELQIAEFEDQISEQMIIAALETANEKVNPVKLLKKAVAAIRSAVQEDGWVGGLKKGLPIAIGIIVGEALDNFIIPMAFFSLTGIPIPPLPVGVGEIINPVVISMVGAETETDELADELGWYESEYGESPSLPPRKVDELRTYIRGILIEGRYEAETTQISRAVVSWVKDVLAKGLPQDEVSKYKRDYPYHNIGVRMFDVPSSLKNQLNRLTATIKVDPDLDAMQDTFEVAGKAGTSMRGTKDLQVQIYLRSDFTLQDMSSFVADLKETIIHELEHTGQSEEITDTAEPHNDRGYDWNKLNGLRNYYSSQAEIEAYAKGAFKKAKVKGITFPEAIDEKLNSSMETFIRRFKKYEEAGATDRLDYNEQDLRDYFQKELRDQILDIARLKYPKAHGLHESNVLATGMCFPFAYQKAEEWFDKYFTPGGRGRKPKKHPNLNDKSKFKVIHGTVTDKWKSPPKPVVHGWVEMGDMVFDDQTKITKPNGVPKDVYYDMYQPEVYKEFTAEEAILNCAMKGGEGPWDDDLMAQLQQRDAWMKE